MQTVDFRYFPLGSGERVLDLGCGEGRHVISAYALGDVHAVGVDLSAADLRTARERFTGFEEAGNERKQLDLVEASALSLPFADASFDKVICSEVLEHIPDYRAALGEIRRVLKPAGLLCISVPRRWPERLHGPYWWLRCLFWREGEQHWLVRQYHKLLVWDLLQAPSLTRTLEKWLNPFMGKSVVLYFRGEDSQ